MVSVEKNAKKGLDLDINLLISVNKGSTVNVLVGDEVGDISVRGSSEKLKFRMSRNGKINLLGTYLVDNGTYEQKLFLKKQFQSYYEVIIYKFIEIELYLIIKLRK